MDAHPQYVRKFTATQISYMTQRISEIVTLCYSTFLSDLKWHEHCATTATELQKSYKLNFHHFSNIL